MGNLSLNLQPTHYSTPPSGTWVATGLVDQISFSVNGPTPAISKYIAYDTLDPPTPFIAVTQDGKGNVVYDGGFPKFYNTFAPAPGITEFSELTASFKFLYNALNFIANPTKVAVGNKKVLLLGDKANTGINYAVKDTGTYGFFTSFSRICEIAGFDLYVKDISDWGGVLNATIDELNLYCAVILMSSTFIDAPQITDSCVSNLVTFRESGNGLMLITDHGEVVTSLEMADTGFYTAFFRTANKVAVNFGSYFSGLVDRSPVNVGYLRANYDDHPLYNGMTDLEDIYAGASESQVVIATLESYPVGSAPSPTLLPDEINTVRALATLTDGSVESYSFTCTTGTAELIQFKNPQGGLINALDQVTDPVVAINIEIVESGLGSLRGDILKNDIVVGSLAYDNGVGTADLWLGTTETLIPTGHGDVIKAYVKTPIEYYRSISVTEDEVTLDTTLVAADFIDELQAELGLITQDNQVIGKVATSIYGKVPGSEGGLSVSMAGNMRNIRKYYSGDLQLPNITLNIFPTTVDTTTALATLDGTESPVIDAATNQVYTYVDDAWTVLIGANAQFLAGAPRKVIGKTNGLMFQLNKNGTITAL